MSLLFLLFAAQSPDVEGRFGPFLRELGPLERPRDVAVAEDDGGAVRILVAEEGGGRVAVLDDGGERAGSLGEGLLERPVGIALGPDGMVAVADAGLDRVVLLGADGALLGELGSRGGGPGELRGPRGVAVDAEGGRVLVADTGNDRVAVFALEDGGFVRNLGGRGREPGRFLAPADVAALPGGRIAVVEEGAHRVQVLSADGEPLAAWGDFGPGPGFLVEPRSVAWHGGRLYVADRANHRVQVFTADGELLYEWGVHAIRPGEGAGSLHYPDAVAVAPSGALAVVVEGFQDRAQVFGPADGPAELYSTDPAILSGISAHYGTEVAAAGDLAVVAEPETRALLVFELDHPEPVLVSRAGGYGEDAGRFLSVDGLDLAVREDGEGRRRWTLLASDPVARRLSFFELDREEDAPLRFDPAMARLVRAVDLETALGEPVEPGAVARDSAGRAYVVDRRGVRVLVLSADLALERVLGSHGTGAGELRDPAGLAVDEEGGRLLVADRGNGRIAAFALDGEALEPFGEELSLPHGLAVGGGGRVVATDAAEHRVAAYDRDGERVLDFGGNGLGPGELRRPRGIAVAGDGRIVVLDHGNHRGMVFSADGAFVVAFGPRLYVRPTR